MSHLLSLRSGLAAALSLGLLAGCGNDPAAQDARQTLPSARMFTEAFTRTFAPNAAKPADPAAVAAVRQGLEQAGTPVVLVRVARFGYANLMGPYGQNGAVTTWASNSSQTVALQDGILVATRGFGPDLMSARVPDLAQVRRASGYFHRGYAALDGADQSHLLEYDCTFAEAGRENIDVFGKTYAARKVTESCEGPDMVFQNAYWFDQIGVLRQSDQHATAGLSTVRLQRIVD
ncbi:MAG: hypothetical protein B7Y02_16015 [Rhodobacterales bacterium 17-64-5]|nr:MAG: hypothetical protein B7Y02_16015 [Rhodobacterales bacterium 17-64-5]